MKASGYYVLSIDGSTKINKRVQIDTDSVFMRLQYGDTVIETAHPDHRGLMEHILQTILDAAEERKLAELS